MIQRFTQAKLPLLSICLLGVGTFTMHGEPAPDAAEILRSARLNSITQEVALDARLRVDNKKIPFSITLRDGVVRYQFSSPDQEIRLKLGADESELSEFVNGKPNPKIRPDSRIRDTPVSYEDLSLQFLYWPNPKLIGDDVIRTRAAWKLEVQAPKSGSAYGVARLWIDKESGAVLRIQGFDVKGRKSKQFEVISAQKIDGQWMLRTMRIEAFDPDSGEVLNRAYLEIDR